MNRSFPALRGVAILLVVLNHTIHMATKYAASANLLNQEPWLHYGLSFLSGLGIFAVPIFLFLSGCFFAYAASRDHRLRSNYKVVWVNVWHVAFPYLIWTLIFYVEIFFLHQERYSLPEYIKNILAGYPFNFQEQEFIEKFKSTRIAPSPAAPKSTPAPARQEEKPLPKDQLLQQWEADPALQKEFGNIETYRAFCQAQGKGLVRIIDGPVIRG